MTKGASIGLAELLSLLRQAGAERRIVAVVGAPGSGKSTLADQLVSSLNTTQPGFAAVLPMDGYHYDDAVLVARGLRPRKGAPDTFDVGGLCHMVERLKADVEAEVAVPVFDRDLEISRSAARVIASEARVIVLEGNYLLLDQQPWSQLQPLFDLTVMIDVPEEVRRDRLLARWQGYGLSVAEIDQKVDGNDLPNGRVVVEGSAKADFIIRSTYVSAVNNR